MTVERRKALVYLSLTLIIGILIGSLLPGFFGRVRHGQWRGRNEGNEQRLHDKRSGFERMIYRVTGADSIQKEQIKPFIINAAEKIGKLEKESNDQMLVIMDSLKAQLTPLLNEEQMKKLEEFTLRAKGKHRFRKQNK